MRHPRTCNSRKSLKFPRHKGARREWMIQSSPTESWSRARGITHRSQNPHTESARIVAKQEKYRDGEINSLISFASHTLISSSCCHCLNPTEKQRAWVAEWCSLKRLDFWNLQQGSKRREIMYRWKGSNVEQLAGDWEGESLAQKEIWFRSEKTVLLRQDEL